MSEPIAVPVPVPPPLFVEQLSPEQIARNYEAAMASVDLINAGKPEQMAEDEWVDCLRRNKEHLQIMLQKSYWTTENLNPFRAALNNELG